MQEEKVLQEEQEKLVEQGKQEEQEASAGEEKVLQEVQEKLLQEEQEKLVEPEPPPRLATVTLLGSELSSLAWVQPSQGEQKKQGAAIHRSGSVMGELVRTGYSKLVGESTQPVARKEKEEHEEEERVSDVGVPCEEEPEGRQLGPEPPPHLVLWTQQQSVAAKSARGHPHV